MRKVILSMLLVVSLLFTLNSCSPNYKDWKTVKINDCGTIKIPNKWVLTEKDGKIYLTDKSLNESDCNIYFVQSHSYAGIDTGDEGIVESNIFSNKIQILKNETGAVISNGAQYGQVLISIDSLEKHMLYLDLSSDDERVLLIVWENSIDKNMLLKIAKSFIQK